MNPTTSFLGAPARVVYLVIKSVLFSALVSSLTTDFACAGSATWNATPSSQYWSYPANWTPATVPSTTADTATFGVSSITSLEQVFLSVGSIIFNPGASAYTLNPYNPDVVTMAGPGIINNSGVVQTINVPAVPQFAGDEESYNELSFASSATAGTLIQYTVYGSSCADGKTDDAGWVTFNDNATAGAATFITYPGLKGYYDCHGQAGAVDFYDSASAENATFINDGATIKEGNAPSTIFFDNTTAANATIANYGGKVDQAAGGYTAFYDQSSAGNATITSRAGVVSGASRGETSFAETATAANAILIANGGPGEGGRIIFAPDNFGTPDGGTARIEVFGNGELDISGCASGLSTGSIEGDGLVSLGGQNLTLGSNNLSTVFSGVVNDGGQSGGTGGALTKAGSARLILTGVSTYTGRTTVESGILLVNNTSGSGTGSGNVFVTGGTFGGAGTVAGRVVVGTGSGSGALLAPGKNGVKPGTLTVQKRLIMEADATYKVTVDSRTPAADKVTSFGASIRGAAILFNDVSTSVIPSGTVFTLIDNTAGIPTVGTFSNLPDGGTVTIGNNTFQANYEGGDGNDLTLTVVP